MRHRSVIVTGTIAAVVLAADQVTKMAVRAMLEIPGTSVSVIGELVRFTYTRNQGAAFGMLPDQRPVFMIVSTAVLIAITAYVVRRHPHKPWVIAALGLVAGGAAGNLIDRTLFGWVTDFIQVPFDFPVFNIADSAVVVGVSMLVWWLLFGPAPVEPDECEATV